MDNLGIKDFVNTYIEYLNKELKENLTFDIKEAELLRYPMYANCANKTINIWFEYYSNLSREYQTLYLIHSYSTLLSAEKFGKKTTHKGYEVVSLRVDPNKIAKEICSLCGCGVGYIHFEILNKKAAYEVKRHIFPFPECAFFKVGDIL